MNKEKEQVICDYINYDAPRLHNLGDKTRAMIDKRYRLYHIGSDITPSQIVNIEHTDKYLSVIIDRGIKGLPIYKIPNPLVHLASPVFLLTIGNIRLYQEYINNITSGCFFWKNFAIFHSNLYWMFAEISNPFELPRWFIMDKYDEFFNIKFSNSMPCPVIKTEDTNYNTVLTPIDNDYIQNLIS